MSSGTRDASAPRTPGQVLEFRLAEEIYCVSIDYVTEIVDPKVVFGVDGDCERRRIVVFEPDIVDTQGAPGWLVDEVFQVVRVDDGDVDDSPGQDDESVRGVVKREEEFVIRVDPAAVHAG